MDEESGEQVWQPAEGGPAVSAAEYLESGDEDEESEEGAVDDDAAAPDEADDITNELQPEVDLPAATGEADDMEVGDDPVERAQPDVPAGEEPAGVAEEEAIHEVDVLGGAADDPASEPT